MAKSRQFDSALLQHVSPLGWEHINLTGDYTWHTNKRVAKLDLSDLRTNDQPQIQHISVHNFPFLRCPLGVRQSIQDDFSRPIEEAVKKPLADFSREVYHARDVMSQVGNETAFRTWVWIAIFVLVGIFLGGMGSWWMFDRDLDKVNARLDTIQQQIAPPAPVSAPVPPGGGKKHPR